MVQLQAECIKSQMAAKMLTLTQPEQIEIGKLTFPKVKSTTKLVDLVGQKSYLLFSLLGLDCNWLQLDPMDWEFQKMNQFVRSVKTVNDCAECSVKLITEYSKILTKDEKTRDWLLQGVELHRKKYPDFNIKSLDK